MIKSKKVLRYLLALIITVSILYVLLQHVSIDEIVNVILRIPIRYLILGFLIYTTNIVFRVFRFMVLLDGRLGLVELFQIVNISTLANNIFPLRTGELSYIYLVKKTGNVRLSQTIASLIIARLFDFIAICLIFLFCVLLMRDIPQLFLSVLYIVGLFVFLFLCVLALFFVYKKILIKALWRVIEKAGLSRFKYINLFMSKLEELLHAFSVIKTSKIVLVLFFSIMSFILSCLLGALLLFASGYSFPLLNISLGVIILKLTTILPINGIAGFGSSEGIWTLVFIPMGMDKESAIITGFVIHIVNLVYISILGILAIGRVDLRGG